MFTVVAAALAGLASFVSAQNASTTYPYSVNPASIPVGSRVAYCMSQNNVCTELCPSGLASGSPYCNPTTLVWTCKCAKGPTPNVTQFDGTIPFFECQAYVAQCQTQNTGNVQKQKQCLAIPCGGKNASNYMVSKSSSSAMPSHTPMPHSGGKGPSKSPSSKPSPKPKPSGGNGAAGLDSGKSYGLAALVAGGIVLFGFGFGL